MTADSEKNVVFPQEWVSRAIDPPGRFERWLDRWFRPDPEKQSDSSPRPGGMTRTVIRGNGLNQGIPMLKRYRLIQNRHFGIYVHRWYRPDADRDCHDHPWKFWTMVLRGGYLEELDRFPHRLGWRLQQVRHRPLGVHHMPLTSAHRVTEVKPNTWTLLVIGPKVKSWGFWVKRDLPDDQLRLNRLARYVPWETYVKEGGRPDPFDC